MNRFFATTLLALCLSTTSARSEHFAIVSSDHAFELSENEAPDEARRLVEAADYYVHSRGPHAKAFVHVEGMLSTPDFYVSRDWGKVLVLALAYRLTGKQIYLSRATNYLERWSETYQLAIAPIIESSDCLDRYPVPDPGVRCLNPIDDAWLIPAIAAFDILRRDLPTPVKANMEGFMRNVAVSYLHDIALRQASQKRSVVESTRTNWHSYRVALATLASFAIDDAALVRQSRVAYERLVDLNMVYPTEVTDARGVSITVTVNDGSVYDFHQRGALHYAVADLLPLVYCAVAAHAHGDDWYNYVSPSGASLRRGITWLTPYLEGREHEEFASPRFEFDRQRAKAGWKGYSGKWNPKAAKLLLRAAAQVDSSWCSGVASSISRGPFDAKAYDPKLSADPGQAAMGFIFRCTELTVPTTPQH